MEGDIAVAEPEASQEESDAAVKAVLSGSVAVVAFQQACKELPRKVSVYARFLEVLEPFTFPGTEKIAEVRTTVTLPTDVIEAASHQEMSCACACVCCLQPGRKRFLMSAFQPIARP